jgi:hypothetical protein
MKTTGVNVTQFLIDSLASCSRCGLTSPLVLAAVVVKVADGIGYVSMTSQMEQGRYVLPRIRR